MTICDEIQEKLVILGLNDLLQMSEIVFVVRDHTSFDDAPSQTISLCLEVLEGLLKCGLASFGDAVPKNGRIEFVPWDLSVADSISRIRTSFSKNDFPPALGEIGWMQLTTKGRDNAY